MFNHTDSLQVPKAPLHSARAHSDGGRRPRGMLSSLGVSGGESPTGCAMKVKQICASGMSVKEASAWRPSRNRAMWCTMERAGK